MNLYENLLVSICEVGDSLGKGSLFISRDRRKEKLRMAEKVRHSGL